MNFTNKLLLWDRVCMGGDGGGQAGGGPAGGHAETAAAAGQSMGGQSSAGRGSGGDGGRPRTRPPAPVAQPSGPSPEEIARRQAEEARKRREAATAALNTAFQPIGDDLYGSIRSAFMDYATPQLDQQFGQQESRLRYALARTGNSLLPIGLDRTQELNDARNAAMDTIRGRADALVGDRRSAVQSARSGFEEQIAGGATADDISGAAKARAGELSAVPTQFDDLGTLLSGNFTRGLPSQPLSGRFDTAGRAIERFRPQGESAASLSSKGRSKVVG